jgi:DNA-directed RNA polymerase sigma subunit (sigma70/sigma32)
MKECSTKCMDTATPCEQKECKHWIDYKKEQNCSLISIYINGPMTLRQVAERLGISYARVKQIESGALKKIRRHINKNNLTF